MRTPPRILIVVAALGWMASDVAAQSPPSQDGGASNRQMTPAEMLQLRSERVEEFLRRLDTNGNGMIDADEVSGGEKALLERMISPSGEVKYPLDIKQVHEAHMKSYRALMPSDSGGAGGTSAKAAAGSAGAKPATGSAVAPFSPKPETAPASDSGPASANVTKSRSTSPHKAIRFLRPNERLPKGLPDWFKAKDTNGDGQISMAEFATEWTPEKEAEFIRLDLNHDGVITPDECLKVEKNSGSRK